MRIVQAVVVIAGLLFPLTVMAENKQTSNSANKIKPLPQDLEIQLALSALPPRLRDNSTVYVLNPDTGYEVVSKGTNGFYTLVDRTDPGAFTGSWPFTHISHRVTQKSY